ncbi:hypothetical protein PG997_001080 [Apiospora hydei]|uniref:Uncharacterized protein n=1 Tax=Apiospora hydei TaxID=1337664 RepID=A0ABR1XCM1_9PEZI
MTYRHLVASCGRPRQNPTAPSSAISAPVGHNSAPVPQSARDFTLSAFASKTTTASTAAASTAKPSRKSDVRKAGQPARQQAKLNDGVFGMRTTKKVYKPRKSNPGYFREMDVPEEEAEQDQELSLIDLTGEPDY